MDTFEHRTLGHFEIAAHLDSGGMADVFLAHQLGRDGPPRLAVIKVLRQRYQDEPEIKAMFRDEARIMTRLNHPNVVRVYEHGEADARPYIAMEYLAGDHLGVLARSARRRGEALAPSLITRIGVQVANALDYIHSVSDAQGNPLNLVHRDISPQNIFVTYEGQVKILDFGIAWSEDRDRSVSTRTGMLKGKLRYMSPEQINSLPLDNRSDLFSLGIVLWELLAGEKLFKADSEFETMKRICEIPIPSPVDERPDVPVTLEAIVMGLLRRPLEERYQNAAELRTALLAFLRDECSDSPSTEIIRQAGRLLGDRQRQKERAIESLKAEKDMQAYLFGDLDEDDEISASSRRQRPEPTDAPAQLDPSTTPPSRPIPAPPVQPPAAGPQARQDEPAWPPVHPRAGMPAWLTGALVAVFILGAGALTLWGLWPSGDGETTPVPAEPPGSVAPAQPDPAPAPAIDPTPPAEPPPAAEPPAADTSSEPAADAPPEPAADAPPKPAADAAIQPAPEPEQPPKPAPKVGFLMVKTSPETKVFMGDRYLGKTPITEMELDPGTYHLTLRNDAQSIRKEIEVHIRVNEVSSVQYIF